MMCYLSSWRCSPPWIRHPELNRSRRATPPASEIQQRPGHPLTAASRLSRALPNATIIIIDKHERHYFQPGYTLVGSGVWDASQVITPTQRFIARNVEWVQADVAEFDPEGNRVVTSAGATIPYDFLIVATGLKLDYTAIDGMDESLTGQHGWPPAIGCALLSAAGTRGASSGLPRLYPVAPGRKGGPPISDLSSSSRAESREPSASTCG